MCVCHASNRHVKLTKKKKMVYSRLKQAKDKGVKEKKSPSRPGSAHASTKVLAARRMSRKDLEEMNPLLAKEVAQAVSSLFFFFQLTFSH